MYKCADAVKYNRASLKQNCGLPNTQAITETFHRVRRKWRILLSWHSVKWCTDRSTFIFLLLWWWRFHFICTAGLTHNNVKHGNVPQIWCINISFSGSSHIQCEAMQMLNDTGKSSNWVTFPILLCIPHFSVCSFTQLIISVIVINNSVSQPDCSTGRRTVSSCPYYNYYSLCCLVFSCKLRFSVCSWDLVGLSHWKKRSLEEIYYHVVSTLVRHVQQHLFLFLLV